MSHQITDMEVYAALAEPSVTMFAMEVGPKGKKVFNVIYNPGKLNPFTFQVIYTPGGVERHEWSSHLVEDMVKRYNKML